MFFSMHCSALAMRFSSSDVMVISLGWMRMFLRNRSSCRWCCWSSCVMRALSTSMSKGFSMYESAPAW